MADNNIFNGLEITTELFTQRFFCLSCTSKNYKRMSCKASAAEKRTKVNSERITSDVWDMSKHLHGVKYYRYFQLIHDKGSFLSGVPPKLKIESNSNIIRLVTEMLAQEHYVQRFTSDGDVRMQNCGITWPRWMT